MGSGSQVVEEAVSYLTAQGQKVGLVKVRGGALLAFHTVLCR